MYKNVFSQLWIAKKKQNAAAERRNEQDEVEYLVSLRNDKTNADEAVIFIKAVLYVLTAFVVYLGFEYYQKTFSEMFSPEIATLFAILLPAIVEIGKIKLVGKFLRAISFGWMGTKKHWSQVGYWVLVGVLGAGSYYWSYTISTGGIKEVAKQNAEIKNKQAELNTVLSAATANMDEQIKNLENSNAQAGPLKNNGRTNWESQPILASNAESLKSLLAQKEQIIRATTEEYQKNAGNIQLKVSAWSNFIERFGGWGEWGVLVCLLGICFFQRSLFEKNKETVLMAEEALPHQQNHHNNGQYAAASNGTAARQSYYFTRDTPGGNARSTLDKPTDERLGQQHFFPPDDDDGKTTVSQSPHTVTQQNNDEPGNHADAVLKLAEKELRGFAANFGRKSGHDSTVSSNINRILTQLARDVRQPGFAPTRPGWLKFYAYLTGELFPMINEKGWPYEYERQLTADVYKAGPKEEPVPT